MWIKNCVSIVWWDDLFLFEAICFFLAHYCLDKINYKFIWSFFNFYKLKAFRQESLGISNRVKTEIYDSEMASIIDDELLSYKYSSLIKYFCYLCGEEQFFKSLSKFVNEFYFKNANTINFYDFFREIRPSSNSPINIIDNFIEHKGLSKLELVNFKFLKRSLSQIV